MKLRLVPAVLAAATLAVSGLAGCGTTVDNGGAGGSSGPSCAPGTAGGGTAPTPLAVEVAADPALVGKLPAAVRSKGTLTVAADASYAPNEFTDAAGKIIGMDVDLGTAIGKTLGLRVTFVNASFDGILAGIAAGRYDLGMSSLTDKKEREKTVDFVTYFTAGTSLMVRKCNPVGIKADLDLCGKKVGAENGTVQLDTVTKAADKAKGEDPTLLDRCTSAGRPRPQGQGFPKQTDVNAALAAQRIDAYLADTPIVDYAVKQTGDQFEKVGATTDQAPYGIAVARTSTGLRDAVLGAVRKLMADGTYRKVLDNWGVGAGAIPAATVNGAVS